MKDISSSGVFGDLFTRPAFFADTQDLVWVTGDDAASYLQGQLTQDVFKLKPGMSKQAFVLEPKGHIDVLLSVKKITDKCFLLGTEAGFGSLLAERLKRFKVRVKADLTEDQALRLSLFSFTAGHHLDDLSFFYRDYLNGYILPLPNGRSIYENTALQDTMDPIVDQNMLWRDFTVHEVLIPGKTKFDFTAGTGDQALRPLYELLSDSYHLDLHTFEFLRISCGIPKMGYEITEKLLPASLAINEITIDYDKGCYTGQELVARLDARGDNVPFILQAVLVKQFQEEQTDNGFFNEISAGDSVEEVESGARTHYVFAEGKNIGRLTSYAKIKDVKIIPSLAFVKRGIAPDTHVEITKESTTSFLKEEATGYFAEGKTAEIPAVEAVQAFLKTRPDTFSLS